MRIFNLRTNQSIEIPVAVDSGFMGDIELEPRDAERLLLEVTGETKQLLADYVTEEKVLIY